VKIAMVVNSDPAFDGRVRREARSLVGAGHEVTVFGVRGGEAKDDAGLGFEVAFPPLPAWIGRGGAFNTLRKTARWYERMRPLAAAAVASKPDAVHAHDLDTVGPASRLAAEAGIPCVYDDHEASYVDKLPNYAPANATGPRRAALAAITRHLQRRGEALEHAVRHRGLAAVVTVSDQLAARLYERFGAPQPVVVRNCPVLREVPRTNTLRHRLGVGNEVKLLVYHGTVTEGSGVENVIRALRELPPNYVFAVVGRVWRQDRYEALARAAGVGTRVRFIPVVPEDEMLRIVASADVGLVPTEPNSVGNAFGLANKFFESMMVGLPMVAAATPAVSDVLQRVKAGLLYPADAPQDAAAIARAVRALCDDEALWRSCREAGLAAARDEFNWEREGRKLVAIYEGLSRR
jgi:glycosyltransferase involved in cell wall biosynthesis